MTALASFSVTATPQIAYSDDGNGKFPDAPGLEIFGFSAGTNTDDKGHAGFANELNGFAGKRIGSYAALSNKMEFSYTPIDNLWLAASAFVSYDRIQGNPDIPDINKTKFQGFSTEAQYRFLERSASNPLALAASAEPFRSSVDLVTGQPAISYGAAFKFLADAVVVPDRVFWAFNAIWVPIRAQDDTDRTIWRTTSNAALQTAVALQLSKVIFVGAEWRYLAAYDGARLNDRVGYANYFGPTFLWRMTDKIAVNATWQPQVKGRSNDNPTQRYDLDNFERAEFRFKLVVDIE